MSAQIQHRVDGRQRNQTGETEILVIHAGNEQVRRLPCHLRLPWCVSLIEANRPQHPEQGRHHKSGREYEKSFRWGVRRALLALLVLTALPAQGSEPIRLQVIPYGERLQEIPVLPYLLLPPPPLLERTKSRKRKRNSGRSQVWEDDFDWLMEND